MFSSLGLCVSLEWCSFNSLRLWSRFYCFLIFRSFLLFLYYSFHCFISSWSIGFKKLLFSFIKSFLSWRAVFFVSCSYLFCNFLYSGCCFRILSTCDFSYSWVAFLFSCLSFKSLIVFSLFSFFISSNFYLSISFNLFDSSLSISILAKASFYFSFCLISLSLTTLFKFLTNYLLSSAYYFCYDTGLSLFMSTKVWTSGIS